MEKTPDASTVTIASATLMPMESKCSIVSQSSLWELVLQSARIHSESELHVTMLTAWSLSHTSFIQTD